MLFRSTWGLQVRAVGESPSAAESAGINVWRVRFLAIVIGGAMAGIGGAALSIGQIGGYLDNITGGRGFIALAVVAFGAWNPLRISGAVLLFGLAEALGLRLQANGNYVCGGRIRGLSEIPSSAQFVLSATEEVVGFATADEIGDTS